MESRPLVETTERQLHGRVDAGLLGVAVRHLQEDATAALQVDHHPGNGGVQILATHQVVQSEGEDLSFSGQLDLVYFVLLAAIYTNSRRRVLDRAAFPAATAIQIQPYPFSTVAPTTELADLLRQAGSH